MHMYDYYMKYMIRLSLSFNIYTEVSLSFNICAEVSLSVLARAGVHVSICGWHTCVL